MISQQKVSLNLTQKNIKDCDTCDHSYMSFGTKSDLSDGYKGGYIQKYVPWDMPGQRCSLTDEFCTDMEFSKCPLIETFSKFKCTICGVEEYCDKQCQTIYYNSKINLAYSETCDSVLECQFLQSIPVVGILTPKLIIEFDNDINVQRQIKTNLEKITLFLK